MWIHLYFVAEATFEKTRFMRVDFGTNPQIQTENLVVSDFRRVLPVKIKKLPFNSALAIDRR